jgi:hypothetical protein
MPLKLKPIIALATFSASLAISASAWASDWVLIDVNADRSKLYVDRSTIIRSGDARTFWVKVDDSLNFKVTSYERLQQYDLDCVKRTINLIYHITKVWMKPDVTFNFYSLRDNGGNPIVPESIPEAWEEFVCKQ